MTLHATYFEAEDDRLSGDGWLAPSGRFYPCRYGSHAQCAQGIAGVLIRNPESYLESKGWCKISDLTPMWGRGKHPTEAQAQFLVENDAVYCLPDGW